MRPGKFRKIVMIFVFGTAAVALFGLLVMWLWNAILPSVTNVSEITFVQALGILLLSKILFGGFRGNWGGERKSHWRKDMKEKWAAMTPEEREKFRSEWRNRCGPWKSFDDEYKSKPDVQTNQSFYGSPGVQNEP